MGRGTTSAPRRAGAGRGARTSATCVFLGGFCGRRRGVGVDVGGVGTVVGVSAADSDIFQGIGAFEFGSGFFA